MDQFLKLLIVLLNNTRSVSVKREEVETCRQLRIVMQIEKQVSLY